MGVCTSSPPWLPFSKGVPGPRRAQRPFPSGEIEADLVPKPARSAWRTDLKVHHALTTSSLPCGHGYLPFLGKQAKRRLRGLPSPHLGTAGAKRALLLGTALSSSLGHPTPAGTELPKEPSPQPSLTEKMQFPQLETPGRGSKVTFPMLCTAAPRGGSVLPPPKQGAGSRSPKGAPQHCQVMKTNLCMCISLYIQHINIYTHTPRIYTHRHT